MSDKKTVVNEENVNQPMSEDKFKAVLSIGTAVFAVIFAILWAVFPYQWYAVFCGTNVGSYVQLLLIALVLSIPMCYLFSKITKINIPLIKTLIVNSISLVVIDFIYSSYYLNDTFYLLVISIAVFFGINIWIFAKAPYENKGIKLSPIKKRPILTIVWTVLYTVLLIVMDILLFRLIAYIYLINFTS